MLSDGRKYQDRPTNGVPKDCSFLGHTLQHPLYQEEVYHNSQLDRATHILGRAQKVQSLQCIHPKSKEVYLGSSPTNTNLKTFRVFARSQFPSFFQNIWVAPFDAFIHFNSFISSLRRLILLQIFTASLVSSYTSYFIVFFKIILCLKSHFINF